MVLYYSKWKYLLFCSATPNIFLWGLSPQEYLHSLCQCNEMGRIHSQKSIRHTWRTKGSLTSVRWVDLQSECNQTFLVPCYMGPKSSFPMQKTCLQSVFLRVVKILIQCVWQNFREDINISSETPDGSVNECGSFHVVSGARWYVSFMWPTCHQGKVFGVL